MKESAEKGAQQNRLSPKIEAGADFYARLGVSPQASQADIAAAFRELSKQMHPDAEGGGDTEKMKLLSEAYSTLKDPAKRASYSPARPGSADPRNPRGFYEDIFRGGPNFDDIFAGATGRGRSGARNENPDDLARSMGYKDFQDYMQQSERRKAERKTNPDIVRDEAIAKVKSGAYFFGSFIDECKKEGIPNVENLIHNEKIVRAIVDESVSKGKTGAYFYGSHIEEWVKVGFNRKQADSNPALLSLVRAELLSKARTGAYFFQSFLDDWKKHNPNLNTQELANAPEILNSLKEQAQGKKRTGEYFYNSFLDEWRKAGVDVEKIK